MIRKTYMGRQFVWLSLFLSVLLVSPLFAVERQRRERPRREPTQNRRNNDRQEKKQLPPEGVEGMRQIQTALKDILTSVNRNQRPDKSLLDSVDSLLAENKRYLPVCDVHQRASFMLAQAWAGYYGGDLDEAMSWALRASKTDDTDQDAWISTALFCMLNDKKPLMPRLKRTARHNDRRRGDEMYGATEPENNLKKGTLDFDVLSLRQEMFSERFEQMDYQKEWGDRIDFQPGTDTLCLLFWQSEPGAIDDVEVSDSNDLTQQGKPRNRMPRELDMLEMVSRMNQSPELKLDRQREYFAQLSYVCKGQPGCKFVEVNTDEPKQAKKVADEEVDDEVMSKKMTAWTYVPLIIAASTGLAPDQYVGLNAAGPFMLVINPEGKLRYAGPAADFVPAFILTSVTGIEIDLQTMAQSKPAGPDVRPMFKGADDGLMSERMPRRIPPRGIEAVPAADPNQPAVVEGHTSGNAAKPAPGKKTPVGKAEAEPGELTPEQQVEADHLLAEAQLHIESSRKIRGKSPEAGIIACREVLKRFPNTEYATKAQMLLRDVPNRFKEKYDITYEELGY